jgi:hypothetical protein
LNGNFIADLHGWSYSNDPRRANLSVDGFDNAMCRVGRCSVVPGAPRRKAHRREAAKCMAVISLRECTFNFR